MGSLIARKKAIMMMGRESILPSEYRQIEYLECSGTQYIMSDYIPSVDNVEATWEFAFTASQVYDNMLWGAQGSNSIKTWQAELYNDINWYVGIGVKQYRAVLQGVGNSLNTKYTAHVDTDYLTIDGHSSVPTSNRTGANTRPISIFAWTNTDGIAAYRNRGCRIYSLEFKEDGAPAANFVPCIRKADSKPGMYDTVSDTFYTNDGTGEFIIPS